MAAEQLQARCSTSVETCLRRVTTMKISVAASAVLTAALFGAGSAALAQPPAAAAPRPPPKQESPIDLTGYWVSIVNEDWRWRMVTPPKGDYASVPLNPVGKAKADTWDAAQDGSCKAFGVAGIMRMPTRLHITWVADDVMKIESDAGEQTRMLYFKTAQQPAAGSKTLQGRSLAVWEHPLPPGAGGLGPPPAGARRPGGDLKVTTSDFTDGWLRRNGVPYSENAKLTEYFDRFPTPDGNEWFVVTTQVDDPLYLRAPFITSSHFRREPDGSKWHPTPCKS
jgi:hypothetical protein